MVKKLPAAVYDTTKSEKIKLSIAPTDNVGYIKQIEKNVSKTRALKQINRNTLNSSFIKGKN